MKKQILVFIVIQVMVFYSASSYSENLLPKDLIGTWSTKYPLTNGEKTTLVIEENHKGSLTREFKKDNIQNFPFEQKDWNDQDGILILKLDNGKYSSYSRLVLSGWKTKNDTRLFGTIYLYQSDELFNGLPIFFEKQ